MKNFHGRFVLVTGAGSGIGRETSLAFAREGARLALADIDAAAGEETAALVRHGGAQASVHPVDVGDAAAMERLAEAVRDDAGVPDIVVNNAGIGVAGSLLNTSLSDWERVVHVNLWGVIHGCRLFAPLMVERRRGGHIVNVASAAAFAPSRVLPAYSTTKAAVLMLSECWRIELAEHGIGVTVICPGIIDTNIVRTTQWVGLNAEEARSQRDRAVRLYRRRNYGPERVAARILAAVRRNRAVVPVTPEAHALRLAARLLPGTVRSLARNSSLGT